MELMRAAAPIAIAAIMALVFALVRPGVTDAGVSGLGKLQWAALGGVLWGLGSFFFSRLKASNSVRGQVAVAAGTLILSVFAFAYPEDVDRIASTVFAVVLAVGIIGGVWILANILIALAREQWDRFLAISAAIAGAIFFAILRGNLSVTALIADEDAALFGAGSGFLGHIEWPVLGALLWGGGVFALRKLPNRYARVGVGVGLGAISGWFIGTHSLPWQRPTLEWGNIILFVVIFALLAGAWRVRKQLRTLKPMELISAAVPALFVGSAIGFVFATWLRAPFIGTETNTVIAAAVPLALLGARVAWNPQPTPTQIASFESRSLAVIFLGPAMLFLSSALVIPAIRTIFLSLLDRDFNRRDFTGNTFDSFTAKGDAFIGFDNYRTLWNDVDSFDLSNWQNIFTSQLFWIALALLVTGLIAGFVSGTKQHGQVSFAGSGSSIGSMAFGGLLLAFAVFSVLRGTFFNNLWWVVTVTSVSVVLGLTIAVLSERAGRGESIAKSLIFMPMAISFVGASIVWRLQYQPRDVSKPQTGVLNAAWVQLGKLSHSGAPRFVVLLLLAGLLGYVLYIGVQRAMAAKTFGVHVGMALVIGHLFIELIRRSLGGFQFGPNGEIVPDTIVFLQEPPFNNVFLMVILIWVQTGFAMVILSAAIKAVPTELVEAARVDGATEAQIGRASGRERVSVLV